MHDAKSIWSKSFLTITATILVVVAIAKLWSATGHARLLDQIDPLTGMSYRYLMIVAALMELTVAIVCILSKSQGVSLAAISWLATNLLFYRIGLALIHWPQPCPCLGTLTDSLHIPPNIANGTMEIVLIYLLAGGYVGLFWHWKAGFRKRVWNDIEKTA